MLINLEKRKIMKTKLNDNMCNFKIGACYKNTKYDPNSDTFRSVKYFVYLGENTFSPIWDGEGGISLKLENDTCKDFVEVTKEEAFRNVNSVDMNDNEVREVAEMQRKIDSYEAFITALRIMTLSKNDINYPMFTETPLDQRMNKIWRWVKEHKDNK